MQRIICEVPFVYVANYREGSQRNDRHRNVLDRYAVGVRSLAPEQFPVALLAADAHVDRYNQVDEIRWDGEQLYRPFTYEAPGARHHLDASILVADDHRSPFHDASRLAGYFHGHGNPVPPAEVPGRVMSSDRLERTGVLAAIAHNLVVCDGVLWRQCFEPAFVWSDGKLAVEFVDPDDIKNPMATIRADRLAEWIAVFHPDRTADRLRRRGHLEVIMPEVLRVEPEGPALLHCARALLRSAESDRINYLPEMDETAFSAYRALRDDVRDCGEQPSPALADAILAFSSDPFWAPKVQYTYAPGHVSRYLVAAAVPAGVAAPAPGR